jgi:hypothetical protein
MAKSEVKSKTLSSKTKTQKLQTKILQLSPESAKKTSGTVIEHAKSS